MEINEKDIKIISVIFLLIILGSLVFLLIKPIILSIIGGLILAYIFFPLYKWILKYVKNKSFSAAIVSLVIVLLIIIPLYFIIPIIINQVFDVFKYTQNFDIQNIIMKIFPSSSKQFIVQTSISFDNAMSKMGSSILNSLISFLLEIPKILFNFVIVAFVFFFTLRDYDKLKKFVSNLFPINKKHEKRLINHFKNITNSVVYGQVIVGIVQGLVAGIGFFLFGIPKSIILTILSIALSIIPILGPFFVWIPVSIYLFINSSASIFTLFLVYNIIIVSNIDNLLRLYLVSKKTKLSQVIILIGMIGGLFIFGLLGLIIGPLLLAYFIILLEAYKENTLSSLFNIKTDR